MSLPVVHSLLALADACRQYRIKFAFTDLPGCSLIHMARNRLVHDFLESDATHILFIDDDCEAQPEDILALVQSGHELCGLPVAKKVIDFARSAAAGEVIGAEANYFFPPGSTRVEVKGGFAKVAHVGTGVMLIARSVFERLAEAHPEWQTPWFDVGGKPCILHRFFWFDLLDGMALGEDVSFVHRCKAIGVDCHMFVRAKTWHHGSASYGIDVAGALAAKA